MVGKVLNVFSAFKSRFGILSTRDEAILIPEKAIMFVRVVDVQDRKDLGVLLDDTITKIGHTNIWENVRDIVVQYTKMAQWLGDQEN